MDATNCVRIILNLFCSLGVWLCFVGLQCVAFGLLVFSPAGLLACKPFSLFASYKSHSNPSFLSLMLKPKAVSSLRILSLVAQSLFCLASRRMFRSRSTAFL